jgi:hypothetical protein
MPYVRVGNPVLSRRLTDPHLDNIACLPGTISAACPSAPSANMCSLIEDLRDRG